MGRTKNKRHAGVMDDFWKLKTGGELEVYTKNKDECFLGTGHKSKLRLEVA